MQITNAELRAQLPSGVTVDATAYPDSGDALLPLGRILEAALAAQTLNNDTAPIGQRVFSVTQARGTEEQRVIGGVTRTIRPNVYNVAILEEATITQVYPVLG